MPTPEQIRLALEQKAASGHPAFTKNQLTERVIKEDSFIGQKIRKAMDLGVSRQQALNFYAYGTANGKVQEPPKQTGFFEKIAQDVQGRRVQFGQDVERYQQGGQTMAETGMQFLGRSAQAAGDMVGGAMAPLLPMVPEAISKAVMPMVPNQIRQPVTQMATDQLKQGLGAAIESDPAQDLKKFYQGLSPRTRANVESAAAIGMAALDVVPGVKATQKVVKETADAALSGSKGAMKALFKPRAVEELVSEVDSVVGQIIQGDKASIQQAKAALQTVDTQGVKTYADLNLALKSKISALATKQNEILDVVQGAHALDEFAQVSKAGNVEAIANPVANAMDQLQEIYLKSGNMDDYVRMKAMKEAAQTEGLTARQVNDLAREYGAESPKAFNPRTGEPLFGINAQLSENTRMGVKEAARSLLPDDTSKLLDEQMSAIFDTLRNTEKVEAKVLNLAQKVTQRGLVEKIGRGLGRSLDLATFGGLRGFLTSLFPSNVGLKMMNYLQIEQKLRKNLERLDDLLTKVDKLPPQKAADQIVDMLRTVEKENRLINLKGGQEGRPGIDYPTSPQAQGVTTGIPKELEPLAKEARKYKSAEEFVKAQKPVFHGTQAKLETFSNKQGTFFTDDFMNADGYAGGANVYEGYLNLKNPLVIDAKGRMHNDLITEYGTTTRDVVGNVDSKTYDGVIFKNVKDSWIDDADYQDPSTIFYAFKPKDAFLNESQLTDIWNTVNRKPTQ